MSVIHDVVRIPTLPNHCPAIHASDEGTCAVIGEDAIRVYTPNLHLAEMDWIVTPTTWDLQLIPAETQSAEFDVGIDRSTLEEKLDQDDVHKLTLDRTASPGIQSGQSYLGYRYAKFSHSKMDRRGRCLLATLTMDHRACIYARMAHSDTWKKIANLSEMILMKMREAKFTKGSASKNLLQEFIDRNCLVAAKELEWSHVYEEESSGCMNVWSYLNVVTKGGMLFMFKVTAPFTNRDQVTLCTVKDTGLAMTSAIHWGRVSKQTGILAVGCAAGKLNAILSSPESSAADMCLSVHPLWHDEDRLAPKNIAWQEKSSTLLFSKGPHMFVMKLEVRDTKISVAASHHVTIGGTHFITGISVSDKKVLVTKTTWEMYGLSIGFEDGKLSVKHEEVLLPSQVEDKHETVFRNVGICTSQNTALVLTVGVPQFYYDHSTMKHPFKLDIKNLMSTSEALNIISGGGPPKQHEDCLLILKAALSTCEQLPEQLEKQLTCKENWTSLSLHRLQLLRFLTLIKMGIEKEKEEKVGYQPQVEELHFAILRQHMVEVLKTVNFSEDFNDQEQWIYNAAKTLASSSNPEAFSNAASALKPEKCAICNQEILVTNYLRGTCGNGHCFDRCCQTLQVCSRFPYRRCPTCKVLAVSYAPQDSRLLQRMLSIPCTLCGDTLV